MIRYKTESGAVYYHDIDNNKVKREGPYSSGINYTEAPDDEWQQLYLMSDPEVGKSLRLIFHNGVERHTTPLVSIEETDD